MLIQGDPKNMPIDRGWHKGGLVEDKTNSKIPKTSDPSNCLEMRNFFSIGSHIGQVPGGSKLHLFLGKLL